MHKFDPAVRLASNEVNDKEDRTAVTDT
jgi:hypothetical protein